MTRVKICGLTREQDVRAACAAGADALGFVMVPGSKRLVRPEDVRSLRAAAHPFALTVGVVADLGLEEAIAIADLTGVHALQFHGKESPATCRALKAARPGLSVFKALTIREAGDLQGLASWEGIDGLVLDSGGGSGIPFDWAWLGQAPWPPIPRIVAGGLTPQNVGLLLERFRPEAVDVSSGVECAPGLKDPLKLVAFVQAVHRGFASSESRV